ncbi:MAG TPA: ABC transporter ATP-binding protein [Paucimonas sp.]|nr:ABC transporter ATP-binding protein [Paucimonas sp.]
MGSIRVTNLGKAYKRYPNHWSRLAEWTLPSKKPRHELKWVLRDINFHIEPGEAVAVIGVNGAGKSTLLKLITGTTQATTGAVDVSGRVAALLELGMGFHPDFTGRQNALMAGQLIGMRVDEVTALMPEIEAFAEIGDYIDQPVRIYSSGMQVRLAFSVATAVRPDILIVDEALAVGDVFFQQKCYERIRSYCEAGTTLLFVSHAMGTVYSLCDRAILLNEGRIALDGSPREVIDLYNAHVLHHRDGRHESMKIVEKLKQPALAEGEEAVAAPALADAPAPLENAAVGSFGKPGARIHAVDLELHGRPVNTVISESEATIRVEVEFTESYDDPHIGFQIRNARGEPVFMTNTYCMYRTIGPVQRGEHVIAEFSFKAGLAAGDYTITAGVAESGTGEGEFRQTITRLQDARAFTIVRNMDAILWTGVYNLDPTCKLRRVAPGK